MIQPPRNTKQTNLLSSKDLHCNSLHVQIDITSLIYSLEKLFMFNHHTNFSILNSHQKKKTKLLPSQDTVTAFVFQSKCNSTQLSLHPNHLGLVTCIIFRHSIQQGHHASYTHSYPSLLFLSALVPISSLVVGC